MELCPGRCKSRGSIRKLGHFEADALGGVNITPDDVFVTISSRDTISPTAGQPELRVEFSLDPVTLDLQADPAVDLRYVAGPGEESNYYALTHGRFQIESVPRADEDTLSIVATVDGEPSAQQTEEPVHNPADVLPLKARFDLRKVSNRGASRCPKARRRQLNLSPTLRASLLLCGLCH